MASTLALDYAGLFLVESLLPSLRAPYLDEAHRFFDVALSCLASLAGSLVVLSVVLDGYRWA